MAKKQTRNPQSVHRCADCGFAKLLHWDRDPLIAECEKKYGERFVANAATYCDGWEERKGEAVVVEMG